MVAPAGFFRCYFPNPTIQTRLDRFYSYLYRSFIAGNLKVFILKYSRFWLSYRFYIDDSEG